MFTTAGPSRGMTYIYLFESHLLCVDLGNDGLVAQGVDQPEISL